MTNSRHNLPPDQFIEWISNEGLSAVALVRSSYTDLSWANKLAWWDLEKGRYEYILPITKPGLIYDQLPFWNALWHQLEPPQGSKRSDQEHLIRAWFSSLYYSTNPAGSDILQAIISGNKSDQDIVQLFNQYQSGLTPPPKAYSPRLRAPQTESQWDELWFQKGPSTDILLNPAVPVSCLIKWKNTPHPNLPNTNMSEYVFGSGILSEAKTIPPSWIEEILQADKPPAFSYPSTNHLMEYLYRPDVPLNIRQLYRQDPRDQIFQAAWNKDAYTQDELDKIPPKNYVFLSARDSLELPIVKGLLTHAPGTTSNWCTTENISEDARIFMASQGITINWANESSPAVIQAALKFPASISYWHDLAHHARRSWGEEVLRDLLYKIIPHIDTPVWTIKRLINLGGIGVTKPLLKSLLLSKSKNIRLLASFSSATPAHPKAANKATRPI